MSEYSCKETRQADSGRVTLTGIWYPGLSPCAILAKLYSRLHRSEGKESMNGRFPPEKAVTADQTLRLFLSGPEFHLEAAVRTCNKFRRG